MSILNNPEMRQVIEYHESRTPAAEENDTQAIDLTWHPNKAAGPGGKRKNRRKSRKNRKTNRKVFKKNKSRKQKNKSRKQKNKRR